MNAIIVHGTSNSPDDYWYPHIASALKDKGVEVWVPALPDADTPSQESTVPYLLEHGTFTAETTLIGHSSGVPLILGVLERLDTAVARTVLIAGFVEELPKGPRPDPVLKPGWDWERIKSNAGEVITINSDDDPWGCDHDMGMMIWKKLGGDLILRHGQGHMGSTLFKQPYERFDLLRKLLL